MRFWGGKQQSGKFSPAALPQRRPVSPHNAGPVRANTKLCHPAIFILVVVAVVLLLVQVPVGMALQRHRATLKEPTVTTDNIKQALTQSPVHREEEGGGDGAAPFGQLPQPTLSPIPTPLPPIDKGETQELPDWVRAVCKEVVFGIKTHARGNCTQRLVDSLHKMFACARVFVADDGNYIEKPRGLPGVERYYDLPYDTGLGACRNFLVDRVDTEYFMLMDDDFVFTPKTNISFLLAVMKAHPEIDILGAALSTGTYHGKIRLNGPMLNLTYGNRGGVPGVGNGTCWYYDIVANFFLSRTLRIRALRWDDDLRIGEHEEFFVRAYKSRYGVAFCNNVIANHVQQRWVYSSRYTQLRLRADSMRRNALLNKHNITTITTFRGEVFVTERPKLCPCRP